MFETVGVTGDFVAGGLDFDGYRMDFFAFTGTLGTSGIRNRFLQAAFYFPAVTLSS